MPETLAATGRSPQPVTPKLIVSRPEEDVTGRSALARRRSKTESAVKDGGRPAAIEWVDIDHSPPRRRRKRSNHGATGSSEGQRSRRSRRSTESEVGGFLPKLARILESGESSIVSRPGTRGSESRRQRDQESPRKTRHRDEGSIAHRRAVKHRVGGLSRRPDPLPKLNPSLLSVLSSLTRSSGHSSSSNTTITQQSYNRISSESLRKEYKRKISDTETDATTRRTQEPNVFDYMEAPSVDGHDGQSLYSNSSSASSHYEPSDAESSELPETPSSHSTFPSPTATRSGSLTGSTGSNGSVAELRRKYDHQFTPSPGSVKLGCHSPEVQPRPVKKLPQIRDDEDENLSEHAMDFSEVVYDARKRSSSRASRPKDREEERLKQHEDAMRHHVAHAQAQHGPHLIDPSYGQRRSHSTSSNGSASSQQAWAQYMAMQRYQYPSPQAPVACPAPAQAMNGHMVHPDRPPVPDAPDLTQRTFAGYELLARELSNEESPVKPMYRKFEYLNHRILLHMQDELQELEEQLRTVDEIIAQMDGPPEGQQRPPASRRGDAFQGSDMHNRRTLLLGRIFQKTEQYNRAMSSFASMRKDSSSPNQGQVESYREWLKTKAPIHDIETKFLDSEHDLILPGQEKPAAEKDSLYRPTKHAALTCLPVGLMLPLLLFSIIPTLAGRLVVTVLITVGAILVAATTRIRHLMPANEWAVCGAAYVLVMAAIAGCIPQHAA